MNDEDTNVRVAVRCRPFNDREKRMPDNVQCLNMSNGQLLITGPTGEEHSFGFDYMFGENSTQVQVWESLGAPILEKAFSGYNGTIFAYGQTGSGKTWSMQGADGDLQGVIPRMNNALFERISTQKATTPTLQFLVTVSYFELYNEVIFDLLDNSDRKKRSKSGLEIKEHPVLGVYVKGLQEIVVDSPAKIQGTLDQGMRHRTVASTQMNSESSRSHSIFTIKIHQKDSEDESRNLFAKVNLVDLAGSERVKSTGATGATLKEGANINKSLSALGNVINALVEQAKGKKGAFVPYRNSKLTRVLQESLGGNSVTVMIAALSPALVNFEETLSTLKYANRAKDIKVKAVKNDESSQISRLNEEIRALREKLLAQPPTNVEVDTSLLEAKHQQQLRDLEEAMKSTWEDKARISEEHEKERLRLEREQQEAQKRLVQQREEHWRLLESRSDIDMTISHLKDLLRSVKAEGGVELVGSWPVESRDILRLEAALSEQFTAIDVYRASVTKDGESLLVVSEKMTPNETKVVLGMWKQLREKFQALKTETSSWIGIQRSLMEYISSFATKIEAAQTSWSNSIGEIESSLESSQIARGFDLILRQVESKRDKYMGSYRRVGEVVLKFETLASKVEKHLNYCVNKVSSLPVREDTASADRDKILGHLKKTLIQFSDYFGENGILARETAPDSSTALSPCDSRQEILVLAYERINCSNRAVVNRAALNGKESWVVTSSCNCTASVQDMPFVDICLPQESEVTAVSLQGGLIPLDLIRGKIEAKGSGGGIRLPCGMGLDDCDGSIQHTVEALSCLIEWEALIKKSAPDKFLKRPPVRFLFDLILLAVEKGGLDVFKDRDQMNWEVTSSSKTHKLAFMDTILSFVSSALHVPPPTTASAIVSGADGHLTNIFLQHLAFVGHAKKENICLTSSMLPPPQLSPRTTERSEADSMRSRETWPDAVHIATSVDGSTFTFSAEMSTNLARGDDIAKLPIPCPLDGQAVKAKYIRIYASSWQGPTLCLRFGVHVLKPARVSVADGPPPLSPEVVLSTLDVLRHTSHALYTAVDFLVKSAEREVLRKQEEVRKQLECLADEKLALEEKLVHEKTALHNEKQGLEEQLRAALLKLEEAEELLRKEKMLREQIESMHQSVVDENASLQTSLREQMEEASIAKTDLLRFQASAERDGKLVETLRQRVEEGEIRITELVDEAEEFRKEKAAWDSEREDLLNQTEVLTEERDAARQNEEELFEELRERTNDLEKLQESYVDMTDRCNEYQDTISDLREEMESMKTMVMDDHRLFVASTPATAIPASISSNSPVLETRTPAVASTLTFSSQSAPVLPGTAHSLVATTTAGESADEDIYMLEEDGPAPTHSQAFIPPKVEAREEEEEEYIIDDDEGGNEYEEDKYEEDEFENDFED